MKFLYNNFETFVGVIIIILGCVAIFVGSSVNTTGTYVPDSIYGGDAYTGIQNAAASTANNIKSQTGVIVEIYELTMSYVGAVMIVSGFLVIAYDFLKYKNEPKKKKD